MAALKTNKEWAEYFAAQPDEEVSAVPFIWTKEDAEEESLYVLDEVVKFTDEEWRAMANQFEDARELHEDAWQVQSDLIREITDRRDA